MQSQTRFFVFLLVYVVVTLILFHLVYQTSKEVVDEKFHLRQGEHYCQGRFHIWDDKITTFPGLYLISASFLSPLKACSVYALRLTSVVASVANAYFIFIIRKMVIASRSDTQILLESISLATLPPLYFFSHLYYTDVLSATMVLMMIYFSLREMHNWGAVAAFLSILMRQTNIVWVVFVLGGHVVNMTLKICLADKRPASKGSRHYGFKDLFRALRMVFGSPSIILEVLSNSHSKFLGYELNILGFMAFLYYNGSIVVGDKSAHEAALHLPQIFYFTLFYAAFSSAHILSTFRRVIRFARKKWLITVISLGVLALIVHKNTIVHPYVLADNRHYTFYIWNRFYGRWWFARYLPIPVYYCILVLLGLMLFTNNGEQTVGFSLLWMVASFASMALQQLIEKRYFLVPFLVLRLLQSNIRTSTKLLAVEVIVNVLVNAVAFYVFFTKEVYWSDFPDPQRIMW